MASLNFRDKGNRVISFSGEAYANDVEGTKKLYIRTGTRPTQVETYGLATVKTATNYSPIAFDADGELAYIGRKETYYTYSTNEKADYNSEEVVNTRNNPVIGGNLVSTKSEPINYGRNAMTTFSNSYSNTVVLVNTQPYNLDSVRTATKSEAYNTITHMSTTFSNSATDSAAMVNTVPNPTLGTVLTRTVSAPYNTVYHRYTTYSNSASAESGTSNAIPSGFPNPATTTYSEGKNGVYRTYYSIRKSQYVNTYKSTASHTYNEESKITASTNGTGDYKCDATVGSYNYQGVYGGTWGDQWTDNNAALTSYYHCSYRWTISTESDSNYYYWSEGIHYANQGTNYGSSNYRPTNYVQYNIEGGGSSTSGGGWTGYSGTTGYSYYSRKTYYTTLYAYERRDHGNIFVNVSTRSYYNYTQSSAGRTTTKAKIINVQKTHDDASSDSKAWWTAPDSYSGGASYGSCHGVANKVMTVTATASSYHTTSQKSTIANVADSTTADTTAVFSISTQSVQVNNTYSRTTYYGKKISYTSTTVANSKTASAIDNIRESALSTYSLQVNATSSYTIDFGKKYSYTNTTEANYKENDFIDKELVSMQSSYSHQVNSTSSYSISFSKKISYTYSTSSRTYSTINNSTLEVPDRLLELKTHNYI